ncbi:kinase-like domain-containing protein [Staphylotrichum tortipilum]|uniref:Kinase-like domain-containing protein n=1 Tax=Staphylotrichum tortipilum TaxID=2831512 RepID=A0AAN6RNQ5_9PEZI|nr:kinase-like domain-containing protein [Staphylotrichum longicolle]
MEYLPQGDLGAYLRQEPPLPESEAGQIISQTLYGLAIMHREKYAHRDSWWVKLTDFDLTKIMTPTAFSSAGQATDGLPDIDHCATDVWSLGATAFHILAGYLPFPGYFDMFQYIQNPDAQFPRAKLDRRLVSQAERDFV